MILKSFMLGEQMCGVWFAGEETLAVNVAISLSFQRAEGQLG